MKKLLIFLLLGCSAFAVSTPINNASLSGTTTDSAVTVTTATSMPALAVNMAVPWNTKAISSDVSFTFSNLTPTAGTSTLLEVTADPTARTITFPTTIFSINRNGNLPSNQVVVPAGGSLKMQLTYTGSRWEILGDPVATNGVAGSPFLIAAGTVNVSSGKTVTATNNVTFPSADLTFTGSSSVSASFAHTGTVVIPTTTDTVHQISWTIDGGGTPITTGNKGAVVVAQFAGTPVTWYATCSPSGSVTLDIYKSSYSTSTAPSSSMVASAAPTVTSAIAASGSCTGWGTITATDILLVHVTSTSGVPTVVNLYFTYQ